MVKKGRDAATADIAVLANSNTWQAYNTRGGGSFYKIEITDDVPISENVSFYRPNPAASPVNRSRYKHLVSAERFLLEWLDREGFSYDVFVDRDIHNDPFLLLPYKLLILNVHPEYWSETMFNNLVSYLNNGGNLMYLGGNGVYWKVVYNTDLNILEVRKRDVLHSFVSEPGGRWKELGNPESAVLGVSYDSRGFRTEFPFEVRDASHWVFDGINLRNGDLFGHDCVGCDGASGHETDKADIHSPDHDLIAVGTNPNNGGAHMIYYQNDAGGQVFSAGSMTYTRSLEADPIIHQITRNVVDRFLEEKDSSD